MHPSALLDLATELVREVLVFDAPTDGVVSAFFRRHRELGHRDRHTLAETVYVVVRQRLTLQHLAQAGPGPIERRFALLAWQGDDILTLGPLRQDEPAWLAATRAVDRSVLPERARWNLPEWLLEPLKTAVGEAEFVALVESLNTAAPLDLRVNAAKAKREDVATYLRAAGIDCHATPFSPWGLRLQGKPALQKLPAFLRGDFEVQDEGSQLLALLTEARRGEMVADFCAGAGGKTLALGAMMRNTGRLYAFDTSGHRLDALKPRLARSGLSNVYPTQIVHENDDRVRRLDGKMDRVLVDAPCSGLGTLRRNPDLKWRQSARSVEQLRQKQADILASAARLVRSGGRLVYATCSLLDVENEGIAAAFGAAHKDFESLPAEGVLASAKVADRARLVRDGCLRLWPHRHSTDGFFAAAWQRR